MDRESVIAHLRSWADGVDPHTGEALAPDHPGQRPDTLRVVFAALALVEGDRHVPAVATPSAAASRTLGLAARNAGRPWAPNDDQALIGAFEAGATIGALALQLERTRGAINCATGQAREDRSAARVPASRRGFLAHGVVARLR